MSKYQIEQILIDKYGEEVATSQIELKRVIGSASIKTVVDVVLPDGKEAVLMLRNMIEALNRIQFRYYEKILSKC